MWFATILVVVLAVRTLHTRETVSYLDFEHPNLTYYNPKYYEYVNFSARRISRRDPIHYVSVHSKTLVEFGNDVLFELFVYEFLSNEYRRSFVEMRYKLCDLMKEKTVVPTIMKFLPYKMCPFPKAEYHFVNVSCPELPLLRTFPFKRGRIFLNTTLWRTNERLVDGFIDMAIKERFKD